MRLTFRERNVNLKGKNTHTEGRPAACDLIRGNKAVDLFPLIKSQTAGRSAVCVFLPLCIYYRAFFNIVE
jgi:hypothetical protein